MKQEILGIGGSQPNDLIMDNFGQIFGRGHNRGNGQIASLKDALGVIRSFRAKNSSTDVYNNNVTVQVGSRIIVCSSATPVNRTDFTINGIFGTAPESGSINTSLGAYNSGLGQVSVGVTIGATGGSGTVQETGIFMSWTDAGNVRRDILIAHDLVTPVGFIPANFINVNYIWQL